MSFRSFAKHFVILGWMLLLIASHFERAYADNYSSVSRCVIDKVFPRRKSDSYNLTNYLKLTQSSEIELTHWDNGTKRTKGHISRFYEVMGEAYPERFASFKTEAGEVEVKLSSVSDVKIIAGERPAKMLNGSGLGTLLTFDGQSELAAEQLKQAVGKTYKATPLRDDYIGEHLGDPTDFRLHSTVDWGWHVKWWTPEEAAAHRIVIKNGHVYTSKGILLDIPETSFLYTMDESGNFYLSDFAVDGRVNHSTLSGGRSVSAAGELTIRNGKIVNINRQSGHFKPTEFLFQQALHQLSLDGVELTAEQINAKIYIHR